MVGSADGYDLMNHERQILDYASYHDTVLNYVDLYIIESRHRVVRIDCNTATAA